MRKAWIRHLHNSLPVALAGVVIFGMATVCRAQTQTDPYSKMPTQASSRMAHRTARAHYLVTREELRTFSEFLKQHPEIASELKKDPKLVNNTEWMNKNADLKDWLEKNPQVEKKLRENPRAFMHRESMFERRERGMHHMPKSS